MREGLSTDPSARRPGSVLSGRYSLNLMTALVWCSGCKCLISIRFSKVRLSTSTLVAFPQKGPKSNACPIFTMPLGLPGQKSSTLPLASTRTADPTRV